MLAEGKVIWNIPFWETFGCFGFPDEARIPCI
jgi:hypothetical protein